VRLSTPGHLCDSAHTLASCATTQHTRPAVRLSTPGHLCDSARPASCATLRMTGSSTTALPAVRNHKLHWTVSAFRGQTRVHQPQTQLRAPHRIPLGSQLGVQLILQGWISAKSRINFICFGIEGLCVRTSVPLHLMVKKGALAGPVAAPSASPLALSPPAVPVAVVFARAVAVAAVVSAVTVAVTVAVTITVTITVTGLVPVSVP